MGEIPAPPPVPQVPAPGSIPEPDQSNLPPPIPQGAKKSNKTWIIVLVVVLVLCCLCTCVAIAAYLYNNGDQIMNEIQMQSGMLLPLFA